jgi:hypothetical protein
MEQEYAQRVQKMADQQLVPLLALCQQQKQQIGQMPLASLFHCWMQKNQQFAKRADAIVQQLQQRVVTVRFWGINGGGEADEEGIER